MRKSLAPSHYLGSAESPTADFTKSGWRALIQILVDSVDSRTCRPHVIWRLRPLCFCGWRLSRTVPACCTGTTCQNFCGCPILCAHTNFHHFLWKIKNSISAPKCPITAPKIRTWSLLPSKVSYHTHRLLNGGHVHVVSTLSLFLISPFCCCSLSRYKKIHRNDTSANILFKTRIVKRNSEKRFSLRSENNLFDVKQKIWSEKKQKYRPEFWSVSDQAKQMQNGSNFA